MFFIKGKRKPLLLPVLKEERLSSDLSHCVKHNVLVTKIHGRDRALGGGQGLAGRGSWEGERISLSLGKR